MSEYPYKIKNCEREEPIHREKKTSKWPDTNYGLLINRNFRSHPYEEPGSCIRALLTTRPEKTTVRNTYPGKLFFDNFMRFSYFLNLFDEGKSKVS